ncbi:MAG: NADH-quinone oxidoreductase subunit NuoK [bacterium]|nr:NADH-quinone oxidoreductase subunit NuoK [bacterium]
MFPSLNHYLILSAALFCIGAAGVLTRKNAIIIFASIELMLNAVNLAFAAFARHWGDVSGQIFVIFSLAVAAAEVAVGLAIIVALFRHKESVNIDDVNLMKW